MSPRWGPVCSLFILAPALLGAPYLAYLQHSTLPPPLTDLKNPITSLPQISESEILGYSKVLSEDIGYRTVGTREHALGDAWMFQKAEEMKKECEKVVAESGRKLECEVWRQEGSGSHRFDMMNKRLYKTYVNLTNIVVRLSDGTPEGKEHSVLVNSHLDSTLPSPGAADDALSVGIMIECFRVLINTPDWSPKHAIIFLFNNAEESLQDGSHLYSTQHVTAPTVRAVINLEAAGSNGRELLFQATSEQMIQAYSKVPRPHGTIFASDIFSSGVILSDTDFRQFEYYLNVTGLDMAVVGNSYLYHMRKDLVEYIQPGVAQHMGENALALIEFLSSPSSPLPSLTSGYQRPSTVYYFHLGHFYIYSFFTAKVLHGLLFAASVALVKLTYVERAPGLRKPRGVWMEQVRGSEAIVAGFLGAVVAANAVAVLMSRVLGKGMSWFANEYSPLVLYGPPALLGALASQLLVGQMHEETLFTSLLLLQSFLAFVIQMLGVGSSAIYFLSALPMFFGLAINKLVAKDGDVSLWTYAIGQYTPLSTGALVILAVLEVFVPLTGRIGGEAPADHIIASIVAVTGAQALPLALPFAHRFGRRTLSRTALLLTGITAVLVAVFSMRVPFDDMHQKRLFILHLENVTTQEHHLHIASADGAPGFDLLVRDIAKEFSAVNATPEAIVMNHENNDWDTLYPFSSFLAPYKVELPVKAEYSSPWATEDTFSIRAIRDIIDEEAGTRSLTLQMYHPGLIWTVVAFDAHVLQWTLDDHPPDEYSRHILKEASFYGTDTWSVDLVVKLPQPGHDRAIKINYVGVQEAGMWPAKRAEKHLGGVAMTLFEDLDGWLEEKTGGTVDATLLGCVGGVTSV